MISNEKLFGNFYQHRDIIHTRLYNHGLDTLQRLTAANGGGDYTTLITLITTPLTDFGVDIGQVDVALGIQIGKTFTVDQVMAAFKLTMSTKHDVIADLLGGTNNPDFLALYPQEITEYSHATKTQMPTLTNRVFEWANAHTGVIGGPLTALLTSFKGNWTTARTDQETQKGVVGDERTERAATRTPLELVLLKAVHTVAALFPGDVDQCRSFFHFELLFPHGHHTHQTFGGALLVSQRKAVFSILLDDNDSLTIRNADLDAEFVVYRAENANDPPPLNALKVKIQRSIKPKPSDLGTGPFLILENLSSVNEGSYFVELARNAI